MPPGAGARTDLNAIVKSVQGGRSKREIIESNPVVYARYGRFVDTCFIHFSKEREWKPVVVVYWGETGTGKTRKAFEEARDLGSPYVHPGGSWFDGYDGGQGVIFDDFGGSEFKLTYLLKLLDRYPMRVPVKGGFVQWLPTHIWITSNYSPKDWYTQAKEEHVRALLRRIDRVVRFRRGLTVARDGDSVLEDEEVVVI